jgi:hypothetical protein
MRLLPPILTLLLLQFSAPAHAACIVSGADQEWAATALLSWERTAAEELRLEAVPPSRIILFDERCLYEIVSGRGESTLTLEESGKPHDGNITLPNGAVIPAQIVSFAAPFGEDREPFLVMALPSVWRVAARHRDDPLLHTLMQSVLVHEMTHTSQAGPLWSRLDELQALHALGDDLDDDIVQTRFATRAGFRVAYEKERELLYAAAAEPDLARRRALAATALRSMTERRALYFRDDDSFYAELEEIFLTMEGVANWAAWRSAIAAGMPEKEALALIRRNGRFWSQDQGLALFLLIDTLLPDWQQQLFHQNAGASELLKRTVSPPAKNGAKR